MEVMVMFLSGVLNGHLRTMGIDDLVSANAW